MFMSKMNGKYPVQRERERGFWLPIASYWKKYSQKYKNHLLKAEFLSYNIQ